MKKVLIIFLFSQLYTNLSGQNFPPPIDFYTIVGSDSAKLIWTAPENKYLSHYNIFYYGYTNAQPIKIASTTNTEFTIPYPTFSYTVNVGVSAEYYNPDGESDTLWSHIICPWLWILPIEIDFENPEVYGCGMVGNILCGTDNWKLTDTAFFSQSHSATFNSDSINYKASLITTEIGCTSNQTPSLSFMCRAPQHDGLSDTLKLYYESHGNWVQISEPLYAINNWQLLTLSLKSLPLSFHFAFEATEGGGNGVYLDDIIFEDETLDVQNYFNDESLIKLFPNPSISSIMLELKLKEITNCIVTICTNKGCQTNIKKNQMLNPGNHKINIDISELSPGLYFVKIILNNKISVKKFIKV